MRITIQILNMSSKAQMILEDKHLENGIMNSYCSIQPLSFVVPVVLSEVF